MAKTSLICEVEYNPRLTDPEGLASAADRLIETVLSTPGIMEEYGDPRFGEFFIATADGSRPKPGPYVVVEIAGGVLQEAYSSDPAVRLRLVDWDTESCTPDDDNGIFAISGYDGRSRLVLVTEFPTDSIDQLTGKDTGRALEKAGVAYQPEPDEEPNVRRRWVLYDLDGSSLLSTRVYTDHAEAAEDAEQANDILVLPLVIHGSVTPSVAQKDRDQTIELRQLREANDELRRHVNRLEIAFRQERLSRLDAELESGRLGEQYAQRWKGRTEAKLKLLAETVADAAARRSAANTEGTPPPGPGTV